MFLGLNPSQGAQQHKRVLKSDFLAFVLAAYHQQLSENSADTLLRPQIDLVVPPLLS